MPSQAMSNAEVNVHSIERAVSLALGGTLIVAGIRQRSLLGATLALLGGDLAYRGVTGHCHIYGAAGINTAGESANQIGSDAPEVTSALTIAGSPQELYAFWRDPHNLAKIMGHFAEVTPVQGEEITHWKVRSPLKMTFEWDSQITLDEPGHKIAWRSMPGTNLPNEGSVHFHSGPNNIGTEVTSKFRFQPPLGSLGSKTAKALGFVPRAIGEKSLRRFKSLVETGEIPTLAHNSSGRGSSDVV